MVTSENRRWIYRDDQTNTQVWTYQYYFLKNVEETSLMRLETENKRAIMY